MIIDDINFSIFIFYKNDFESGPNESSMNLLVGKYKPYTHTEHTFKYQPFNNNQKCHQI